MKYLSQFTKKDKPECVLHLEYFQLTVRQLLTGNWRVYITDSLYYYFLQCTTRRQKQADPIQG